MDAEWFEVIKNKESLKNNPAQMVNAVVLDNTNYIKLKKMAFILLPLIVICSIVAVVAINSDRMFKPSKK